MAEKEHDVIEAGTNLNENAAQTSSAIFYVLGTIMKGGVTVSLH